MAEGGRKGPVSIALHNGFPQLSPAYHNTGIPGQRYPTPPRLQTTAPGNSLAPPRRRATFRLTDHRFRQKIVGVEEHVGSRTSSSTLSILKKRTTIFAFSAALFVAGALDIISTLYAVRKNGGWHGEVNPIFRIGHYSLFRGMRSRPPRWKRMLFR
jgi:hypothetical protein